MSKELTNTFRFTSGRPAKDFPLKHVIAAYLAYNNPNQAAFNLDGIKEIVQHFADGNIGPEGFVKEIPIEMQDCIEQGRRPNMLFDYVSQCLEEQYPKLKGLDKNALDSIMRSLREKGSYQQIGPAIETWLSIQEQVLGDSNVSLYPLDEDWAMWITARLDAWIHRKSDHDDMLFRVRRDWEHHHLKNRPNKFNMAIPGVSSLEGVHLFDRMESHLCEYCKKRRIGTEEGCRRAGISFDEWIQVLQVQVYDEFEKRGWEGFGRSPVILPES